MNNRRLISLTAEFIQRWQSDLQKTAASHLDPIMTRISPEDRPKLTATISGFLRHKLLVEHLLEQNSTTAYRKIHPPLKALLLTAIFQLLFDETVPDHAVLHAAVSLCAPHQKPFANAILRQIIRKREHIFNSTLDALPPNIRYSVPKAFLDHLTASFPESDPVEILDYLNREPVFHTLDLDGYPAVHAQTSSSSLAEQFLSHIGEIERIRPQDKALHHHKTLVQNISSQFVSYLAVRLKPRRMLDLCAAPGSKSALAALMAPHMEIVANDRSFMRLKRFASRITAQASPFQKVSLCCGDALVPPFSNTFDLVLLDAPCSALGTMRKHPDRRYDVSDDRIEALSRRQKGMIQAARSHFSRSSLLYSVCTFTPEETRHLIREIMQENPGKINGFTAAQAQVRDALQSVDIPFYETNFGSYILPDRKHNTDIFFICLFPPKDSP